MPPCCDRPFTLPEVAIHCCQTSIHTRCLRETVLEAADHSAERRVCGICNRDVSLASMFGAACCDLTIVETNQYYQEVERKRKRVEDDLSTSSEELKLNMAKEKDHLSTIVLFTNLGKLLGKRFVPNFQPSSPAQPTKQTKRKGKAAAARRRQKRCAGQRDAATSA